MKSTVIGYYGGPGCGKSTTAASLYAAMKISGMDVELVTEYAKDLVWAGRTTEFGNQFYIVSKQYHRLWNLNGKVQFIITDSPLLLNYCYHQSPNEHLKGILLQMYNEFDNIDVLIRRTKAFNPKGRRQNESESIDLDGKIIAMMNELKLPYLTTESHNIESVMGIVNVRNHKC
jgi:AAA domain-containing protein